jgi:hypothetical protein
MPSDMVEWLSFNKDDAIELPEVRTHFGRLLVEARPSTPEAFLVFVRQEMEAWRRAVLNPN